MQARPTSTPRDRPRPRPDGGRPRARLLRRRGGQSGTTAFVSALRRHPDVFVPALKEPHYYAYLADPNSVRMGYADAADASRRYQLLYADAGGAVAVGDGSTSNLSVPGAATVLARHVPDARIVAILRHPVDRAFSHWSHFRAEGAEALDFAEAVQAEPERLAAGMPATYQYLGRSRYSRQLAPYYDLFRRDQVLVHLYDDLVADPRGGAALDAALPRGKRLRPAAVDDDGEREPRPPVPGGEGPARPPPAQGDARPVEARAQAPARPRPPPAAGAGALHRGDRPPRSAPRPRPVGVAVATSPGSAPTRHPPLMIPPAPAVYDVHGLRIRTTLALGMSRGGGRHLRRRPLPGPAGARPRSPSGGWPRDGGQPDRRRPPVRGRGRRPGDHAAGAGGVRFRHRPRPRDGRRCPARARGRPGRRAHPRHRTARRLPADRRRRRCAPCRAVEVDGAAVAFLGPSGMGKSTVVTLCCAAGALLVTDDVLRLDTSGPGVECVGGSRQIRLRPHTAWALDHFAAQPPTTVSADGRVMVMPAATTASRRALGTIVPLRPSRVAVAVTGAPWGGRTPSSGSWPSFGWGGGRTSRCAVGCSYRRPGRRPGTGARG